MIFLDTTIFVSGADESDTLHSDGVATLRALGEEKLPEAVTTDFVMDEVLTLLRRRHAKPNIISDVAESLITSRLLRIVYVDASIFKESLVTFRKYGQLSFTDAVTLAVMKKYKIREILLPRFRL